MSILAKVVQQIGRIADEFKQRRAIKMAEVAEQIALAYKFKLEELTDRAEKAEAEVVRLRSELKKSGDGLWVRSPLMPRQKSH